MMCDLCLSLGFWWLHRCCFSCYWSPRGTLLLIIAKITLYISAARVADSHVNLRTIREQMLEEALIWQKMDTWNVMLVLWMVILGSLVPLELFQVALISTFFFVTCFLSNCWIFWNVNCRSGVRNAIKIAALLVKEQMSGSSLLGRIPPM